MPASVFSQMNTNSQLVEDQRALQLAFELSLLGLNGEEDNGQSSNNGNLSPQSFADEANKKSANMTECVPVPSSEHVAEIVGRQGRFLFLQFIFRRTRHLARLHYRPRCVLNCFINWVETVRITCFNCYFCSVHNVTVVYYLFTVKYTPRLRFIRIYKLCIS